MSTLQERLDDSHLSADLFKKYFDFSTAFRMDEGLGLLVDICASQLNGYAFRSREHFTEKELSELAFRVAAINGWNRMNVAFRTAPGSKDKLFGLDKAGLH